MAGVRLLGAVLIMATASCLFAQEEPVANLAQAADSSQSVRHDYRFEVASIRPGAFTGFAYGDPRLKPQYSPGHYREDDVTLAHLAGEAFGIKHSYELETPDWMNNAYFTLNATLPDGASRADIPVMLRHLLEDRFGLRYHHATRQMSGYELVVVKSGLGLTKSPLPASQRSTVKGPPIEIGMDGKLHVSKDARSTELNTGTNAEWHGRNETMKQMADQLVLKLDAPVIDRTGLDGEYDFMLLYTPATTSALASRILSSPSSASIPSGDGGGASAPVEQPLLRDALREQLGLELRRVKNVTVDVVIIDEAKQKPTQN